MPYTDADIQERVAALLPETTIVDRTGFVDPQQWLDSVGDLIIRVVGGDADAVYYLASKLTKEISDVCGTLTAELAAIAELVVAARKPSPTVSSNLARVVEGLYDMEVAEKALRAEIVADFQESTKALLVSSRLPTGQGYLGKDPAIAREELPPAIELTLDRVEFLRELIGYAVSVREQYASSELEDTANNYQVSSLRQELLDRLYAEDGDTQALLMDTAIASSLMKSVIAKTDILTPKYEGACAVTATARAVIYGDPLPFTVPESAFPTGGLLTLKADQGAAFSITCPVSPPPVLAIPADPLEESATAILGVGDGVATSFVFYIKNFVKPGSVVITGYDGVTGAGTVTAEDSDAGSGPPGDGVGALQGVGVSLAAIINYKNGYVSMVFSNPIVAGYPVAATYSYYRIGMMENFNDAGVSQGTFKDFGYWKDNTSATDTLIPATATPIGDAAELKNKLDAVMVGFTGNVVDGYVEMSSDNGGSAGRLAVRNDANTASIASVLSAPTWTATPVSLNQALSSVHSTVGSVYGQDTELEDLAVASPNPNDVILGVEPLDILDQETQTLTTATQLPVSDDTNIEAGDNVEFSSPVPCVITVGSVVANVVTLSREYPLPVDTGAAFGLVAPAAVSATFRITRNRLKITSNSSGTLSELEVTVSGFGFPVGVTTGLPTEITLSETLPTAARVIRPGDLVFQDDVEVGAVTSVTGAVIGVELTSATLPFTAVTIKSLGATRYGSMLPSIYTAVDALAAVSGWEETFNVYAFSGAHATLYGTQLGQLTSAISALRTATLAYEANQVTAVEGLLSYLTTEKLGAVSKLLQRCRLADIALDGISGLSEEAALEQRFENLIHDFDDGEERITTTEGKSHLTDYIERPYMAQHEPSDSGEEEL